MIILHPACIAGTAKDERFRLQLVTGVILLALGAIVVLLRLQGLAEFPPRLDADEAIHGLDALQVLQGGHAVFFDANHGREGLIVYAIALCISILGRTELAIRLPMALVSVGAVFVVFWLGRTLFGRDEESGQATPWRGLFVGGVGAGLLAVSLSQTMIGRMAMRGNFLPFLISLCMVLLWGRIQATELVADRAGGGMRWAAAVHLYSGTFHALTFALFWSEFSGDKRLCHQDKSAGWSAEAVSTVDRYFRGRGRIGGCAHTDSFCSTSRRLFYSQQ